MLRGSHPGGEADRGAAAHRVTDGNLDRDDPDAVGILDPHLDQAQGSVAGVHTAIPASR